MGKTTIKLVLTFLGVSTLSACAELGINFPEPGTPGNRSVISGSPNPGVANSNASVVGRISQSEAQRIARELGFSGFRPLPPGIARNLARGRPLPPGIAKRYPPETMLARLPRIPDHIWQIAGKDLVLIAVGTLVVADIIFDVF